MYRGVVTQFSTKHMTTRVVLLCLLVQPLSATYASGLCEYLVEQLTAAGRNPCTAPLLVAKCPDVYVRLSCSKRKQTRRRRGPTNHNRPKLDRYSAINAIMKECCFVQKVQPHCMDLCRYDLELNIAELACRRDCADSLKKITYCAVNNMDNRECCIDKAYDDPQCMPFCTSLVPFPSLDRMMGNLDRATHYYKCFKKGNTAIDCHVKHHTKTHNYDRKRWRTEVFPEPLEKLAKKLCESRS